MEEHFSKDIIVRFSRWMAAAEDLAKDPWLESDYTATQIHYLEMIYQLGNPSLTELAKAMGNKKPSVTVSIDRLVKKGCVYRSPSDEDRRTSHLHLTDLGLQINRRHDVAHHAIWSTIKQRLSDSEATILFNYMEQILKGTTYGK